MLRRRRGLIPQLLILVLLACAVGCTSSKEPSPAPQGSTDAGLDPGDGAASPTPAPTGGW